MRVWSTLLLLSLLLVAGCASAPKHEVIPVPDWAAETLFDNLKIPDNCESPETAPCSLDNRCPVRPNRPLKCYGPVQTGFFCCWKDPF